MEQTAKSILAILNGVEKQLWEDKQLPTTSVGQGPQSHSQSWKSRGMNAKLNIKTYKALHVHDWCCESPQNYVSFIG